jgi:hypothetical protein
VPGHEPQVRAIIAAVVQPGANDEYRVCPGRSRGVLNRGRADGVSAVDEGVVQGQVAGRERHDSPDQRHPGRAHDVDGVDHAGGAGEQVDQHPGGVLGGG